MAYIHFHNCRSMIGKVHADTKIKRIFFAKLSHPHEENLKCAIKSSKWLVIVEIVPFIFIQF